MIWPMPAGAYYNFAQQPAQQGFQLGKSPLNRIRVKPIRGRYFNVAPQASISSSASRRYEPASCRSRRRFRPETSASTDRWFSARLTISPGGLDVFAIPFTGGHDFL